MSKKPKEDDLPPASVLVARLLGRAWIYCEKSNRAWTIVAKDVTGDPAMFDRIRSKGTTSFRMYDRIRTGLDRLFEDLEQKKENDRDDTPTTIKAPAGKGRTVFRADRTAVQ